MKLQQTAHWLALSFLGLMSGNLGSHPIFAAQSLARDDYVAILNIRNLCLYPGGHMIHEVKGDMLFSHAQVIAHCIAPQERFDQGLALSLCQQWPGLLKDFRHYCHISPPKCGGAWIWSGALSRHVVSLLTHEALQGEGDKAGQASIESVDLALRQLRHLLENRRFANVALPRLATGAGGMDWKAVRPLIERHLGELALSVYIYTSYEKGKQAAEPGLG